jgi:prepilin-type N-terminal cleavage/methylation domain-containing protein
LNNFFKNNKGLTLVEILVASVIGSITVAAIYFSFGIFSNTYLGIISKVQVSKDIRNALTVITKDVRLAGYTSKIPTQSGGVSFAPFTTMNNKIIIRKNTYFNQNSTPGRYDSGNSGNDVLEIIYDRDRSTRVRVSYAQSNDGFLKKRLSRCLNADCLGDSDYVYNETGFYDYQPIAGQGLEGFKVTAFNAAGTELAFSQANQAQFIRVSVLYSSAVNGDVHKTEQQQTFKVEELTVSKNDRIFRDMASVLIYPRNIQLLK